jgi:hypothetical protein
MSSKPISSVPEQPKIIHPGMMGDGTGEQNIGETGDPSLRINQSEANAAFGKKKPKRNDSR